MSAVQPTISTRDVLKSIAAVAVYVAILPFLLLISHVRFMQCLVSLCDHLGKLSALLGLNPVSEQYITE